MLMIKQGPGPFSVLEYPPAIGLGNLGFTSDPKVALGDHKSWPGWSPRDCATFVRNRKVTSGGPRVNGWAYTKPYIRSLATSTVEGMNAYADPWFLGYDLRGHWEGIPSWALSSFADDFGEYLPNLAAAPAPPPDLLAQAQTEMLVKLADRKVHLGNALAESRKTVSMIASRMLSVLSAYRAIRRGNFSGAAAALGISKRKGFRKSAADQWLELQYGWKPLLSDIYGGAELLQKGFRDEKIVRVSRKVSRHSTIAGAVADPNYEGSCSVSVIAIGFYKVNDEFSTHLSSLGLINPLEIVWELTPYSFILDWFLPVGDWLTALTASTGMDFIDGCFSVKARGDFVRKNIPLSVPPPNAVNVRQDLRVYNKAFAFQRIPFTGAPSGQLYMKSPFTSGTRIGNALALFEQLRRKR